MPTEKVTSTKQFVHSRSTKFGVPGNRLFRKLRRRLFHTMRLHLYHHSIFQNDHQWHILFQLAENSYQSFQMASHYAAHSILRIRFSHFIAWPTIWKIHLDPKFEAYSRKQYSSKVPCYPAVPKRCLFRFLFTVAFRRKFVPGLDTA